MPSGDAQRTWFPEMIEMLRTEYDATCSIPELVAFTDRLDGILQRIRAERRIVPPMFWCPCCGKRVRSAKPRVSVRAAILALGRFGIADRDMVKSLGWTKTKARLPSYLTSTSCSWESKGNPPAQPTWMAQTEGVRE